MALKTLLYAFVLGVIASLGVAPAPGYGAETCPDWQEMKPYIDGFYKVEGTQQQSLIKNFNEHAPRTNHHPDIIGYTNSEGWDLVQLIMFDGGCLIVDQPYPRLVIWQLMGAYPTEVAFDKVGKTYTKMAEDTRAAIDAAYERSQKVDKAMGAAPDVQEGEMPLVGGVGEMN